MEYYVFAFVTTTDALMAEKLANASEIESCSLIPLPSQISGNCGFALKSVSVEPLKSVVKSKIQLFQIYKLTGFGKNKIVERIF